KLSLPLKFARRAEFVGPMTLKLAGHPLLAAAAKEFNVDPKADAVNVELDLTQVKLPPGQYALHVQGQAKLKYANNPDAAKAAQTAAQQADKQVADLAAVVRAAEASLAEVAKGNDAAAKAAAERALAEAKRL